MQTQDQRDRRTTVLSQILNFQRKMLYLKTFSWIITRFVHHKGQIGFNIRALKQMQVPKDNVGYLPTIDAPETSVATTSEIVSQALKIKDALKLSALVVTFDQAIHAKTVKFNGTLYSISKYCSEAWGHPALTHPMKPYTVTYLCLLEQLSHFSAPIDRPDSNQRTFYFPSN